MRLDNSSAALSGFGALTSDTVSSSSSEKELRQFPRWDGRRAGGGGVGAERMRATRTALFCLVSDALCLDAFFQRGGTMEVVTRRQSGDLTHVLCVEKNETPAAEQNKKGFCPADSNLSLEAFKVPPPDFVFSFQIFVFNSKLQKKMLKLS